MGNTIRSPWTMMIHFRYTSKVSQRPVPSIIVCCQRLTSHRLCSGGIAVASEHHTYDSTAAGSAFLHDLRFQILVSNQQEHGLDQQVQLLHSKSIYNQQVS